MDSNKLPVFLITGRFSNSMGLRARDETEKNWNEIVIVAFVIYISILEACNFAEILSNLALLNLSQRFQDAILYNVVTHCPIQPRIP